MSQLANPHFPAAPVRLAPTATATAASATAASAAVAPTALLVGPMKAGTSWLYEFLKTRRDVVLPQGVKETFYFDRRFHRKPPEWYLGHFCPEAAAKSSHVLEVAPTYFHHREVPQRVVETLGAIPVVVTLREPAARAFSLFQHMRRYGYTSCRTFRSAVERHPEIVQSSCYSAAISRWERAVGEPNVKVLWMEDLQADPLRFAGRCCEALGIDPPSDPESLPGRINAACRPRCRTVAWLGRTAADALRSYRLYSVVEIAKHWGLKSWFFGTPSRKREAVTEEDRCWFMDLIEDDLRCFQSRWGRDASHWFGQG